MDATVLHCSQSSWTQRSCTAHRVHLAGDGTDRDIPQPQATDARGVTNNQNNSRNFGEICRAPTKCMQMIKPKKD
jgi:hypothetical protein